MVTTTPTADRTTLMIKPVGAMCNLRCTYCYYLPTLEHWGGHERRMSEDTLETIFAEILPRWGDDVTIAWQGGEPTMAGLPFFERAIELQRQYARPGQRVSNAIQTNGTLLNDDWCQWFKRHEVLVGLSHDGPDRFHNHYRIDTQGKPSADAVRKGLELLRRHGVEYNILCVLNDFNVEHPDEVYGFFINRNVRWLQFIPAIEWDDHAETDPVMRSYSPTGEQYGRFLCRVFDLWFERHRTLISVRLFDAVLNKLVTGAMPFCILDGSCHHQLTVEHDGSVFGCDHFVEPRWRLGQADSPGWSGRLDHPKLTTFARRKTDLPEDCRKCPYLSLCHGGCPKHRQHRGDVPEPTQLCAGYRMFYDHAMDRLQWLAGYLRTGAQPPPPQRPSTGNVPRNSPCPCGSGKKFKHCHGKAGR